MKISKLADPFYLLNEAVLARSLTDYGYNARNRREELADDPQKFTDNMVAQWPGADKANGKLKSDLRDMAGDLQNVVSSDRIGTDALKQFANAATSIAAYIMAQGIGPALAANPRFHDATYVKDLGTLSLATSENYSRAMPGAKDYLDDPAGTAQTLIARRKAADEREAADAAAHSAVDSESGAVSQPDGYAAGPDPAAPGASAPNPAPAPKTPPPLPDFENMAKDLHNTLLFAADWNEGLKQLTAAMAQITSAMTGQGMGEAISPFTLKQNIGTLLRLANAPKPDPTPKTPPSTPTLDENSRDLTAMARDGKLDPVIGRAKETDRAIQILCRRTKNNPVFIGEAGVGKTAIAEGLAQRIASGNVPKKLRGKRIVELDLAGLVAGTRNRGEFEEKVKKVLKEVKETDGQVLLFIDELHTMVKAGDAEGGLTAGSMLKPALSRGELHCLGATTLDEYQKYVESDSAMARRFQPVLVGEPTVKETQNILKQIKDRYEKHHEVKYNDKALDDAAEFSHRYLTERHLPDSAIDLMDEAGARVSLRPPSAQMNKVANKLTEIENKVIALIPEGKFDMVARLGRSHDLLEAKQQKLIEKSKIVDSDEIAGIVSEWTGIPVASMQQDEADKLLNMEAALHKRVVSQDEAVTAVSEAIRRGRAGLKDPKRPVGSFIFAGPTGVGKTELARALAEHLFNDENAVIRFDMSEYMEKHSVSKLIGAPPGYVGYEEGGQLTEQVRRHPYSVVLFDEIEKAHPDVFNVLLQVLEDGRLTDSKKRTVDFKNCIIIMTSNLGNHAEDLARMGPNPDNAKKKENTMDSIKRAFNPEFLNRIDDILVFNPLTGDDMKGIADIMLKGVKSQIRNQGRELDITQAAKLYLAKEGFDPAYGARPLRRLIQKAVENPLADKLIRNEFKKGETILLDSDGKGLSFSRKPADPASAAAA